MNPEDATTLLQATAAFALIVAVLATILCLGVKQIRKRNL